MGHFYHNLLSAAFVAFSAVPVQAGSSPSNHPVYLALEASGVTANFEVVGSSIVSAQQVHISTHYVLYNDLLTETSVQLQLFLGTADKVYIVDKTENNPTPIHGHPAWAAGT